PSTGPAGHPPASEIHRRRRPVTRRFGTRAPAVRGEPLQPPERSRSGYRTVVPHPELRSWCRTRGIQPRRALFSIPRDPSGSTETISARDTRHRPPNPLGNTGRCTKKPSPSSTTRVENFVTLLHTGPMVG